MKWKAEQLDFDFIAAESADEICVTLTRQQALFLYSAVNVFNWRTRWYSASGGAVNMDAIQSMIADAISRLQTGMEGECVTMAVVDIDFVNDPCSLVIEFSNGTTKTIPFEGTCLMPPPPEPIENYVISLHPECVGGQIAYSQWDESLGFSVTKFVDISACLPEQPAIPTTIVTGLTCTDGNLFITSSVDGEIVGSAIDLENCLDIPVLPSTIVTGLTCVDGNLFITSSEDGEIVGDAIDLENCLDLPPMPDIGAQLGLDYYSPEVRCRAAQRITNIYITTIVNASTMAQIVGAVDEYVLMPALGYNFDKEHILTSASRFRNMVIADLTEISTFFNTHRDDPDLTCIFYDLIPANMRIPETFAQAASNGVTVWLGGAGFTTAQVEAVTQCLRSWSSHTFQNMVTDSLMRPDYEMNCDTCLPDTGGNWFRNTNFANNSGVPPHTITGATRIVGNGLRQDNAATPIQITFPYVVDQCCIELQVAINDHAEVNIIDNKTGVILATGSHTGEIGGTDYFLEWIGSEGLIPITEDGITITVDFDDIPPVSGNYVVNASYHGLNTTPPTGMVTGYVCG